MMKGVATSPELTCQSPLVIIITGQSNAANYGSIDTNHRHLENNQFMLCGDSYFRLSEPMCGASNTLGHPWRRLASKLTNNLSCDCIVMANTAIGGATLEVLSGPLHSRFIRKTATKLKSDFGKIDLMLIQHGESHRGSSATYESEFAAFQHSIGNLSDIPTVLARTSYCHSVFDPALLNAQDAVIKKYSHVFAGPNTDLLSSHDFRRLDQCHFNEEGLNELAKNWSDVIVRMANDKQILKETK